MIDGGSYDPNDNKLFTLNWGAELDQISQAVGETVTVATSAWTVSPAGPTIGAGARAPTISADGRRTSLWITGGTPGTLYSFKNSIVGSDTPTSDRDETLQLLCEQH